MSCQQCLEGVTAICSGGGKAAPVYDASKPLACGADKDVFIGTLKGKKVAVCVAKKRGAKRLEWEIQMLKHVGSHPHIAALLYSATTASEAFLALEAVEPIGFDLDRLVKQYSFAKQSVPSLLSKRLINQLASALKLMHNRKVVHRDVKVENVLVTKDYDAKLIDMGIAVQLGSQEERWVWSAKGYMAPEVCVGNQPQGPEIDCWGLGVILHQMYQHRWDIVDSSRSAIKMRPNRPCQVEPMADDLKEAMIGLLSFDVSSRWNLDDTMSKIPPDENNSSREGWQAPKGDATETRKWIKKYKDHAPPLTAFAAVVDNRNSHLIGKRVDQLNLRSQYGATLLLMDVPADPARRKSRVLEKSPKRDTEIVEGAWLYFGIPAKENTDDVVSELKKALFPNIGVGLGRSINAKDGLMAFTLEFDCFSFPQHIGSNAAIGPNPGAKGGTALNLRKSFGLNLAGVMRTKSKEPEWFPGPAVEVEPGDLGLVVRCPCRDGSTDPTVTDADLDSFMNASSFKRELATKR